VFNTALLRLAIIQVHFVDTAVETESWPEEGILKGNKDNEDEGEEQTSNNCNIQSQIDWAQESSAFDLDLPYNSGGNPNTYKTDFFYYRLRTRGNIGNIRQRHEDLKGNSLSKHYLKSCPRNKF
jgi:hypothetical protein